MSTGFSNHGAVPLQSGLNGENQARALAQAVTFTRVELAVNPDGIPLPNVNLTMLANVVGNGTIESYSADPNVLNQMILMVGIPPVIDANITDLLIYAKYGEIEFPHTHVILAAPFPVRTTNSQAILRITTRVDPESNFTIKVAPDIRYMSKGEVDEYQLYQPVTVDYQALAFKSFLFHAEGLTATLPPVDSLKIGTTIRFDRADGISVGYLSVYDPDNTPTKLVLIGTDGKRYEDTHLAYRNPEPIKATLNADEHWEIKRSA